MFPEITVTDLAEKLKSEDEFILLDVRELTELNYAKLEDSRLEVMPMSRLSREGTNALSESAQSQDAALYVMCHMVCEACKSLLGLQSTGMEECYQCARRHRRSMRARLTIGRIVLIDCMFEG